MSYVFVILGICYQEPFINHVNFVGVCDWLSSSQCWSTWIYNTKITQINVVYIRLRHFYRRDSPFSYARSQPSHWVQSLECLTGSVGNGGVLTLECQHVSRFTQRSALAASDKLLISSHDFGRRGIPTHIFFACRIIIRKKLADRNE